MPAACRGRPIFSTSCRSGGVKAFDQGGDAERLRKAVGEIVRKQIELGIDVIDDGEYGKPSFVSYINERLGGYEVDTVAGPRNQWATSREGTVVSRILRADPRRLAPHPHGLHRPDHLQGPRAAQARHRQSQGRAQRT